MNQCQYNLLSYMQKRCEFKKSKQFYVLEFTHVSILSNFEKLKLGERNVFLYFVGITFKYKKKRKSRQEKNFSFIQTGDEVFSWMLNSAATIVTLTALLNYLSWHDLTSCYEMLSAG